MFIRSPKALALLIVSQRKKLKFSQATVGKLVGLKQQTISKFEMRPENTQIDTLFRILSALNLEIQLLEKDTISTIKMPWKEEW